MISLQAAQGLKILELGGGENPNPASTVNVDFRKTGKVHFATDLNKPAWNEIGNGEFDVVFSQFCLEHISYKNTMMFLANVLRVLKPCGKAVIVIPNTEAQLKWVLSHPEGWDGKGLFHAASEKLFGTQLDYHPDVDYGPDSHKAYFSPAIASELFMDAGFVNVLVRPYGERETDMCVEASKPMTEEEHAEANGTAPTRKESIGVDERKSAVVPMPPDDGPNRADLTTEQRAALFDRRYFNGGGPHGGLVKGGFYWDYPHHEITAAKVLERKPASVLELGCGRGYVLKRLEDAGVQVQGWDISRHCWMTRLSDKVLQYDVLDDLLPVLKHPQLCFSINLLEYIPEECLPKLLGEMKKVSKAGLHGIDFIHKDGHYDKLRCTVRSKAWWEGQFAKHGVTGHEIVDADELKKGTFPQHVLHGDGKVKVNLGCFMTMFHHGWENVDIPDLAQFAQANGYRFRRHDLRNGLPYSTGAVDLIFLCHVLEHLTYREGLALLREMRRVLRPEGAVRIIVPDAEMLCGLYANKNGDNSVGYGLEVLDEVNEGCSQSPSQVAKLHAVLYEGHQSVYDYETLSKALKDAGFAPFQQRFREALQNVNGKAIPGLQILHETLDMHPSLSLYVDAVPG